jgi:hypothetical protein
MPEWDHAEREMFDRRRMSGVPSATGLARIALPDAREWAAAWSRRAIPLVRRRAIDLMRVASRLCR